MCRKIWRDKDIPQVICIVFSMNFTFLSSQGQSQNKAEFSFFQFATFFKEPPYLIFDLQDHQICYQIKLYGFRVLWIHNNGLKKA